MDFDGPIACQVGYQREKGVEFVGADADGIFFTSNDPDLMRVSVTETTPYGARLHIKCLKRGTPVLQARLGSVDGPIVATQEVDEFTMYNDGSLSLLVDERYEGVVSLVIRPFVSGLTAEYDMFAGSASFGGDARYLEKPSDEWVVAYDEQEGENYGVLSQKIVIPSSCDMYCYRVALDQHSKHGTWVALSHANGRVYKAKVDPCPDEKFKDPEEIVTYDVSFHIKQVSGDQDVANHKDQIWLYRVQPEGPHANRVEPDPYFAVDPDDENEKICEREKTFSRGEMSQECPETVHAAGPPVLVGEPRAYSVMYEAKLKGERLWRELGKTEIKVNPFEIAFEDERDFIAVTPGGDAVAGVDKLNIIVKEEKKVDPESWKIEPEVDGLEISGDETSATVTATSTQTGTYVISASNAEGSFTDDLEMGIGSAAWSLAEDQEGPLVFSGVPGTADDSPTLIVPAGGENGSSVQLTTKGAKVVFWIIAKVEDELTSDPESIIAEADGNHPIEVKAGDGVSNVHYVDGLSLKVGVSESELIDYPGAFDVRVYQQHTRSVLFAHPYYSQSGEDPDDEDMRLYYKTGDSGAPVTEHSLPDEPGGDPVPVNLSTFIQGANAPYSQQACIEFSTTDDSPVSFFAYIEEVVDGEDPPSDHVWTGPQISALYGKLVDQMGERPDDQHVWFCVDGQDVGTGSVGGRQIWGFPVVTKPEQAWHELGHNLRNEQHTEMTFMNQPPSRGDKAMLLSQLELIDVSIGREVESR